MAPFLGTAGRAIVAAAFALLLLFGGSLVLHDHGASPAFPLDPTGGRGLDAVARTPSCVDCVVANITGLGPTFDVAFDSENGNVFATSPSVGTLDHLVGTHVEKNISLGPQPTWLGYDGANGNLYVSQYDSTNVWVVDGSTDTIPSAFVASDHAASSVYDPANQDMYVMGENITIVDGRSDQVVGTIPTNSFSGYGAFDPNNNELFATNYGRNSVSVIDTTTNTVVANIPVWEGPGFITFDPTNQDLYVSDMATDNITVISGATQHALANISLPTTNCGPVGIAFDGGQNEVVAVSVCGYRAGHPAELQNLTLISPTTNSVVGSIPVGYSPSAVAYDPQSGDAYVSEGPGGNGVNVVALGAPDVAAPFTPFGNATYESGGPGCGGSGSWTVTITFTGSARGGDPPYAFSWYPGDGAAQVGLRNATVTFPGNLDDWAAMLNVTDSAGNRASTSVPVIFPIAECPRELIPLLFGLNGPDSFLLIMGLVLVTLFALLAVAILVPRRRKQRIDAAPLPPPPPPAGQTPPPPT